MTDPVLIQKCRDLRRRDFTLGQIMQAVQLPKTTVFDHIRDIPLSEEVQKRIEKESIERLLYFSNKAKGKCRPGREIAMPNTWSNELLFLTAHFIFDGELRYNACVYHNRSEALIAMVASLMDTIFKIKPYRYFNQLTGVNRVAYFHVDLARYFREKAQWLKRYIKNASLVEKKIFLRAFFDDEGCASFERKSNRRRVRGYQHNLEMLKLIQRLLQDCDIKSRIEEKYKELVISDRENLIKFRDRINFSKEVYINPDRKNSVWRQKLEKREILNKMINSYQTQPVP